MKLNHRSLRRVLALALSLLLALTPTLSGGVLASGEPETPRETVQNSDPVFFDANGAEVSSADDITTGGVMLSKTAAPVEGDPYSFDITLTVAAEGISKPAPKANIVLVLDGSSSMNDRDTNPSCGKGLHRHSSGCYDLENYHCGKEPHTHNKNCPTCGKVEHEHNLGCLLFGCDQFEHKHTAACYEDTDIEHTHTNACRLKCGQEEHGRYPSFMSNTLVHLSSCYQSRAASAMQAAEDMISAFLKANISANLAVVGFGNVADCSLPLTPLTEENRSDFSDAIDKALTIGTNVGTNMEQGIVKASELLSEKTGEQNFIIVISDGEPTLYGTKPNGDGAIMDDATETATKNAATAAKSKATLYGVAFTQDIDIMKTMFAPNYYTATNAADLESKLVNSIAKSITTSISGVISDTMSGYVDYVELATDTDADVAATVSYDAAEKALNWNPGDLSVPQSITYRVTLNATYDAKNSYDFVDANSGATLTFTGADQSEHTVSFPVPKVSAPLYKVTYQWAAGSATPDGATLPTDSNVYRKGAEFTVSTENYAALTDYTFSGWDILSGVENDKVTGDITVEGSLTKKATPPTPGETDAPSNKLTYVVKYYHDSVALTNYIDEVNGDAVESGTDVESLIDKNAHKPVDANNRTYEDGVIDTASSTVITEDGQVINVVYKSKATETTTGESTTSKADESTSTPTDSSTESTTTKATTTSATTTEGTSNEPPVTSTSEPPVATSEPATTTEPATSDSSDVSAVTTAPSESSDGSTEAPSETTPDAPDAPIAPVDPDVPDTSDTNHTTLFAAMAVLSAMGLLVLLLNALNTRKSRKK